MPDDTPNSTAAIFANALRTTRPSVAPDATTARTVLRCPACGAPRVDAKAALVCSYCDSKVPPVPARGDR